MAFLRKLISLIGRGPTAVATAGVIGTSVSFPEVINNVGPGCVGYMNGVGDLWVSGSRWTRVAKGDESGASKGSEWEGLIGVKHEKIGSAQKEFPCYSFLITYGGAALSEQEEDNKSEVVRRECSNRLWSAVKNAVTKGWKKFEDAVKKRSNGSKRQNGDQQTVSHDEVKKVIEKLKEVVHKRSGEDLWTLMKEIKQMSQEWWHKNINNNAEEKKTISVHDWWEKNVYTVKERGDYGMELENWPDLFELETKKIIDLDKKFSITEDKLKQGLSKTPTFCAST